MVLRSIEKFLKKIKFFHHDINIQLRIIVFFHAKKQTTNEIYSLKQIIVFRCIPVKIESVCSWNGQCVERSQFQVLLRIPE